VTQIIATKIDEAKFKVSADSGVAQEISEFFAFRPPGYQWHPAFKCRAWDGYVRMFQPLRPVLPTGLISYLKRFCEEREYELIEREFDPTHPVSTEAVQKFCASLRPTARGKEIEHHDYQIEAIRLGIEHRRAVLVSPTASGKSLIIYSIVRWLLDSGACEKVLLIVPTINLVTQMKTDFTEYSQINKWDVEANVHKIMGGMEKRTDKPVVISTWQSIYELPADWFRQFDCVIPDEAHTAKAKSLTRIMECLVNAHHRIGTTGTLDDSIINRLVLIGHMGDVHQVITTRELMDDGRVADLQLIQLRLDYDEAARKSLRGADYQTELDFVIDCRARTRKIARLVRSLEGNTLVVFNYKRHGKMLFESIRDEISSEGRNSYHLDGSVNGEERERIRLTVNGEKNCALTASFGVFQLGVNVPNLRNLIFASPIKGKIRNLQSIGRVIRKSDDGSPATLFDIVDDLSTKEREAYCVKHAQARMEAYVSEKFKMKFASIKITAGEPNDPAKNSRPRDGGKVPASRRRSANDRNVRKSGVDGRIRRRHGADASRRGKARRVDELPPSCEIFETA
jgi:superfamily II DNA or RNA helicase